MYIYILYGLYKMIDNTIPAAKKYVVTFEQFPLVSVVIILSFGVRSSDVSVLK